MTTQLKACPFCGGHAEFEPQPLTHLDESKPRYGGRVRCSGCGAEGQYCYSDDGADTTDGLLAINREDGIEHWNTRAAKGAI